MYLIFEKSDFLLIIIFQAYFLICEVGLYVMSIKVKRIFVNISSTDVAHTRH